MAEKKEKAVKATSEKETAKKAPAKKTTKKEEVKEVEKVEEKPAKARKAKEEKKAEPAKPAVTEARCIAKNVRVTPRKMRLVIDLVRGKSVDEALAILANVNKAATAPVTKAIKSAAANATNNFGMDKETLYVAEIQASDGIKMKRYTPRAKGSASSLVKRSSNLLVVVKERK